MTKSELSVLGLLRDAIDELKHGQDKIHARIDQLDVENKADHDAVVKELGEVKDRLGGVVTWRALGFGLGLAATLTTVAFLIADHVAG